jgi:hypothetical protein
MTFGQQTEGPHASALVRGRFLLTLLNQGANALPVEKAAWPCASLDPWGSDGGAELTCQVQCFCFVPL